MIPWIWVTVMILLGTTVYSQALSYLRYWYFRLAQVKETNYLVKISGCGHCLLASYHCLVLGLSHIDLQTGQSSSGNIWPLGDNRYLPVGWQMIAGCYQVKPGSRCHSLHGNDDFQTPTIYSPSVKLEKLWHKLEMENVCLQCCAYNPTCFKRVNFYFGK